MPKPTSAVKLSLGAIPKELKKLDRWIFWRYTQLSSQDGKIKWTKTPHNAAGRKIDATDFNNGMSFVDVVQALKKNPNKFDGVGFLLGSGIAGIDVDDCIDENGNLDERGQRISEAYRETYAEVSPSGKGFKILVNIGDDPKLAVIGKSTGSMEIYGGRRYFTVTGAMLPGHKSVVAPMAQAFEATAAELGIRRQATADIPATQHKDALGIDMKAARELLDHLPFKWCDEYFDWIRAGMALHHEFDGSLEALELWDEWSQRSPKFDAGACAAKWGTFGRPGKEEVTVRTLVRDAQATGWRAPSTIERAIRDFSPFDDPSTVDEDGVITADDPATAPLDWWQRYSVGPMLRTAAPAKQWIWSGVLRQGKVLVLGGSGGSSKSYLMLGAAFQYSIGADWGPFTIAAGHTPGKVLLIYGEEDAADIHDRVQALRFTFMLSDAQIELAAQRVAVMPLRGSQIELARMDGKSKDVIFTEQLDRLEKRIEEFDIKLLVMDPMALLHALDENDNHAIAAFMARLDGICMRTNCSIVLVHHFGKGGPMKAREVNESNLRGASALVAHARTVVVMHRLREDEAAEWGVPEDDHSRWVMWAIAKNNYGPSGRRAWFNINGATGAVTPAPADLVYVNTRDMRAAVAAAREQQVADDLAETAARRAAEEAEETIRKDNRVRILLREAERRGKLPTITDALAVLETLPSLTGTKNKIRSTLTFIRNEGLVDTDGKVSTRGRQWLEDREFLE